MLNFHQLRVFYHVARTGSFSRAADELSLGQPNISLHVKNLEQELGVTLAEQAGRELRLTEVGAVLYGYAAQMFSLEREAEGAIDGFRGLSRGRVVLGAGHTPAIYALPNILLRFAQMYPDVNVTVEVGRSDTITERMLNHEVDLAMVGGSNMLTSRLQQERLMVERMFLVCHPEHQLLQKPAPLEPRDLDGQPMIMREPGSPTRIATDSAMAGLDTRPHIVLTLPNNEAIKEAVKTRLGLSVLSELTVRNEVSRGELAILDVRGFKVSREHLLLWRSDRRLSPAAAALAEQIRSGTRGLLPND